MRVECKYYESRTYANGDTVRKCGLGLAPEAPWRCPDNCPSYERRLADIGWSYGTLVNPKTPDAPRSLEGSDGDIAALLASAKDIVNSAAPDVLLQIEADRLASLPRWRRWLAKRRKG
jgi:hypothetical protein